MQQQSSKPPWINATGRMSSSVKFLGPITSRVVLPSHQSRLKLVAESAMATNERQIVQSEPTRPKPEWSSGSSNNTQLSPTKGAIRDLDDEDGFEDILQ